MTVSVSILNVTGNKERPAVNCKYNEDVEHHAKYFCMDTSLLVGCQNKIMARKSARRPVMESTFAQVLHLSTNIYFYSATFV